MIREEDFSMALLQVNYLSKALFRTVQLQVILPVDKITFQNMNYLMKPGQKFKTLYLLHGLLGNDTDWISGTRIQRWAEEKNLAVIMPSGENSFYVNGVLPNSRYGEFIGHELVEITRKMFPLSDKREDTFIGGLSMGGFGAIRNGLKYSDTFGNIACLSGALHVMDPYSDNFAGVSKIFGNMESAAKSDMNPLVAMKNLITAGREKPDIYIACGLEDSLLKVNRRYRDILTENGFNVVYEEEPGGHEWDFWDRQIKKVIEWLPLSESSSGLSSGNVRGD